MYQKRQRKYSKKPARKNGYEGAKYVRAHKNEIMLARRAGTPEQKVTFYELQTTVSNAGLIRDLFTNMAAGTGPIDNRLGNDILPTSLRVHLSITMGPLAGTGDGTNICRLIIFQWEDSISPSVAGVLHSATDPRSMYYWNNIENLNILSDKMYALKQYTATGTSYDAICDKIYVKGKRMGPVRFNSASSLVQKGGIYALLLTDSAVTPAPYYSLYTQITYTDA